MAEGWYFYVNKTLFTRVYFGLSASAAVPKNCQRLHLFEQTNQESVLSDCQIGEWKQKTGILAGIPVFQLTSADGLRIMRLMRGHI